MHSYNTVRIYKKQELLLRPYCGLHHKHGQTETLYKAKEPTQNGSMCNVIATASSVPRYPAKQACIVAVCCSVGGVRAHSSSLSIIQAASVIPLRPYVNPDLVLFEMNGSHRANIQV